jgi:hypothetical protein
MPVILPEEHHDFGYLVKQEKRFWFLPGRPDEGVAIIARVILSLNRKLKPFPRLWDFFSQ